MHLARLLNMGRRLALAWLLVLLAACGGGGGSDAAPTLRLLAGDGQQATVNTTLPVPVSVRVLDAAGLALAGQVVRFVVVEGGGDLFAGIAITDESGRASEIWTLGPSAGRQVLEVRALTPDGQALVLHVEATAAPDAPVDFSLDSGGDQVGVHGLPLPQAAVVIVRDRFGNPVPGVSVRFTASDGGRAEPATASTGADGRASTQWTLGAALGPQSLSVAVAALPVQRFEAVADLGGPAFVTRLAGDGQVLTQHSAANPPLAVRVTDVLGTPLADVEVTFGSATPGTYVEVPINTPARLYTDADGVVVWPVILHSAGTQQIRASVAGPTATTFTLQVTPSGSAVEGGFQVTGSFDDAPGTVFERNFTLRQGAVYFPDPYASNDRGIVVASFDEDTGSVTLTDRQSLNTRVEYSGTFSVAVDGRVSGSGTLVETYQGVPTGRVGHWAMVKVHD